MTKTQREFWAYRRIGTPDGDARSSHAQKGTGETLETPDQAILADPCDVI